MNKNSATNNKNVILNKDMEINDLNLDIVHQIAATINHEINNPLTSIIGMAEISEIAMDNGMQDTLRKSLQNIIQQAERIRMVTQKLEGLAEIESVDYIGSSKLFKLF